MWVFMPLLLFTLSATLAFPIEYLVSNLSSSLQSTRMMFTDLQEETQAKSEAIKSYSESESRYQLLADNVQDIIWTTDLNLQLTYISPSVLKGQCPLMTQSGHIALHPNVRFRG